MNNDSKFVTTKWFKIPSETYEKCEEIAARLEVTVDYLIEEFSYKGQLFLPEQYA